MKKSILLLTFLTICNTFAQKVDLVNAPENPIVLKYKLEHFALKGDVYSYDSKYFFNKEGLLVSKSDYQGDSTFEYENGKLVGDDTYYELKENAQGYIPRITKQKSVTEFTYNDKGLLITEVETRTKSYNKPEVINKITYSYDTSNRVIKKEEFENGILQTSTTYSYIKEGTIIKVFKKETESSKTTSSERRYKSGQLIYSKSSSDNIELKIEKKLDAKGNSIRDAYVNNGKETDVFNHTILYFSDANSPISYTLKIAKAYNGFLNPQFQRNGNSFYTSSYVRLETTTDMLLYDGLTQTYYVAKNAYDTNLKEGTVINFEVISKGKEALLYTMANNSISAFFKGKNIFLNASYKKSMYIFDNVFTCFSEKGNNNKKTLFFKDAKNNMFTAGDLLPANKENMYYYLDGKQNTQAIVKEGERILPLTQLFGIKATQNGGLIGYINKDIVYCFPNYYSAEKDIIYPARLYDPKIDKILSADTAKETTTSNANITSSNVTTTNTTTQNCTSGNCTDGYGKLKLSNGTTQEGFFTNGKLNGYGTETYLNTDNYTGNFVNNVKSGYGIYYWKNSNTQYYGQWENDKINGYGYLVKDGKTTAAGIYTNGNLTKDLLVAFKAEKLSNGNCLGNCVDGYGTKTYNNGDGYTGIFYNGKPYKAGNYRWNSSKSSFVGDFDANGKLTNYGMYIADSYVYVGEITLGKLTGKAIKVDKETGKQIQGEFKDGVLVVDYSNPNIAINNPTQTNTSISNSGCLSGNCTDGYGTYKYDNSTIDGFFKDGKANGYGNQTYDKSSYSGNFKYGNRDGFGVYYWTDTKQYYIGEWKAGKQHGYGYYRTNNVITHAGYYENGSQVTNMIDAYKNNATIGGCKGNCVDGFGELSYSEGAMVTGFFKNSKISGPALIIWANKDVYIGNWIDNARIGHGTYFYSSLNTNYYGDFSNNKFNGLGVYFDKDKKIISKGYWVDGKVQTNM